ncbi:MAG: hypothetical protein BWK73_34570 [Thiothrix lacustris]|uniref:Uncharacterized protein n=1 Tax=Thiothrix lacustris TaxID=525917 RepID=A0A1Y1QGG4_9GAMM|nr:MAG: hypothetical protein BWK73_34570 [Thiothrix lacustris]
MRKGKCKVSFSDVVGFIKNAVIYSIMGIVFVGFLYFIFNLNLSIIENKNEVDDYYGKLCLAKSPEDYLAVLGGTIKETVFEECDMFYRVSKTAAFGYARNGAVYPSILVKPALAH